MSLLPISRAHFDLSRLVQRRLAAQRIDLVFLKEEIDTCRTFLADDSGTLDDLAPVEIQTIECQTELGCTVLHVVIQLGVFEERLGRYAAPVVAGAAVALPVHTGNLLAKLCCADGAFVTGRAGTDNNQVIICHMKKRLIRP